MAISYRCMHCGANISAEDDQAGKTQQCPQCRNDNTVPVPSSQTPAAGAPYEPAVSVQSAGGGAAAATPYASPAAEPHTPVPEHGVDLVKGPDLGKDRLLPCYGLVNERRIGELLDLRLDLI